MAFFALYKTLHPRFMTSSHQFYDITPAIFDIWSTLSVHHIHCIDDIKPTEFLRSHPLYMTTSYPLYMTSQPLNMSHHAHSFNDITLFVCRTWHPLYVKYHIHSIKHHVHILWHHTTLFIISYALYSWHHHHYIWNGVHCICVIPMTLLMISHQLYVWHHTHFRYAIVCTLHYVTSTHYDFTPL